MQCLMTKQASQRDERKKNALETTAIVFNTLLQHFSAIKIEYLPYSQNFIPSLFVV